LCRLVSDSAQNKFKLDPELVKEELEIDVERGDLCSLRKKCSDFDNLLVELFHILKRIDTAKDEAFGFSVAAKAKPGVDDHPWIESVNADSPAASKLLPGQLITRINEVHVAGLSAKEVRGVVRQCGARMRMTVKATGDHWVEALIWRGRLGCLRDCAVRWCRRAESIQALGDCSASRAAPAAREVQRALQAFLDESERLELPELCDALQARASKCQGPTPCAPFPIPVA
jgi:hypothetical protein